MDVFNSVPAGFQNHVNRHLNLQALANHALAHIRLLLTRVHDFSFAKIRPIRPVRNAVWPAWAHYRESGAFFGFLLDNNPVALV
jgi:hypothetical protein